MAKKEPPICSIGCGRLACASKLRRRLQRPQPTKPGKPATASGPCHRRPPRSPTKSNGASRPPCQRWTQPQKGRRTPLLARRHGVARALPPRGPRQRPAPRNPGAHPAVRPPRHVAASCGEYRSAPHGPRDPAGGIRQRAPPIPRSRRPPRGPSAPHGRPIPPSRRPPRAPRPTDQGRIGRRRRRDDLRCALGIAARGKATGSHALTRRRAGPRGRGRNLADRQQQSSPSDRSAGSGRSRLHPALASCSRSRSPQRSARSPALPSAPEADRLRGAAHVSNR